MTIGGMIMMTLSVGGVVALTVFCFWRVLRTPAAKDHLHAPLEIDTHDKNT
jgi:hypothetical protein